jgi:hypothetical protein
MENCSSGLVEGDWEKQKCCIQQHIRMIWQMNHMRVVTAELDINLLVDITAPPAQVISKGA